MIAVDIKSLLLHLNSFCTNALQNAAGLCVSRTHYEITVEHLIAKFLEEPRSDWPLILPKFGLEVGRLQKALEQSLEDYKTGNAAKPVFSPHLLDLIQDAWLISSIDLGAGKIRSGAVLLAFLAKPALFATGRYAELLKPVGRETLMKDFWALTGTSTEAERVARETPGGEGTAVRGDGSFTSRFCMDFTRRAVEGDIDPVFGRDNEIRQMIDILARRRKNNPICVGEPGVGKTAVVEGMALRIIEGDVPDMLKGVTLLGLDMGALEAGAGMKGEFENRLKGVINEIKASEKPIILFIDEAHTLIGAGGAAGGGDAANLLKPALARGELRTIAATTWSEYKKYFEKDPALARRFQLVKLDEPDVATTILMLRGLKANYEKSHKVVVRDDAVEAAAELSHRYITGRFLPDKAIDLLDTSCARVKVNLTGKPAALEAKERIVQACEREIRAMERDRNNGVPIDEEKYADAVAKRQTVNDEGDKLREKWLREKEAAHKVIALREELNALTGDDQEKKEEVKKQLAAADQDLKAVQGDEPLIQIEVDPDAVAQVVSDWTGIPLGKMLKDEAETIIHLEDRLKERIKGQDAAMSALAEVIRAAKSGIKSPTQPLGVFLFAGPSGTGKTETGLALADLLFGSEKNTVTINMSEFQESHTVSRLIGSPPGYVGYGEGGMLTEAVRQRPYSVVLLDEAEKAHIDVMNLFYQIFDKGIANDGEGKEINFRNTIIILTSNLASDVIQEMTAGGETPPADVVTGAVRPILSAHFKPALLARMTVIPFYSLNAEAMRLIVELKLKKIQKSLMENNKMAMTYAPAVVAAITERCTEVETGARNIEYILNSNVLPRLSQTILTHMSEGGMPSRVHLDLDAEGTFTFAFGDNETGTL
ncbi:MAG TPA: type VI secretion system ATPase TssH [Syntrophales bacterium]|jgi:type VI secretion system protein VasG|nr:type VI secretion system ATPase TssH [Syntrophales bacterium]HOU77265.1 type VI secretion system ATPase TssH [Syntrophales bacterium]HPC32696.1 type VI secretion system ATPase TssH [Syntrophales bacterium]HQG34243.1 type VI secretion system ATPase TssH [Syntrophales bacterium]HQI35755.1 type VI secretion system ATPase TssH [Syntrophales bacterium]